MLPQPSGLPTKSGRCKLDLCDCDQFRVHQYKFTLSCIECGHLADFHDVDQSDIEAKFCLSKSTLIQTVALPPPGTRLTEPPVPRIVEEDIPSNDLATSSPEEKTELIQGNAEAIQVIASSMKQRSPLISPEIDENHGSFLRKPTVEDIYSDIPPSINFQQKRDFIVKELFTTEQTYVRNLIFLINEYKVVMQGDPVLSNECPALFLSLPEILTTNKALLNRLYPKIMKWTPYTTIGDDLAYLSPFLRMYKSYCSFHDSAVKRAQELMSTSPKFFELNEVNRRNPHSNGLDIFSYLIMPVQRIPRYTLLIQELVKSTNSDHPDYDGLKKAAECFSNLAREINEGIRESENRAILFDIQSRFSPPLPLVEPHRSLVHKGGIWSIEKNTKIRRYAFLLSDLLLECSRISEKELFLIRAFNSHDMVFIQQVEYEKLSFGLCSDKFSCMYVCDNLESYQMWVNSIAKVEKNGTRPASRVFGRIIPIWQPDYSSNICMVCKAEFWMFRRRHHCRICGKLMCDSCSLFIQIGQTTERVCKNCTPKTSQ